MADGAVHVLPSDTGWRVEVDAEERARSIHQTQAEAIVSAREVARRSGRELLIHGRDGEIRDRVYGGQQARSGDGAHLLLAHRPSLRAAGLILVVIGAVLSLIAIDRIARGRWY